MSTAEQNDDDFVAMMVRERVPIAEKYGKQFARELTDGTLWAFFLLPPERNTSGVGLVLMAGSTSDGNRVRKMIEQWLDASGDPDTHAQQQIGPDDESIVGAIPLRERRTLADEWRELSRTWREKLEPDFLASMREVYYAGAIGMHSLIFGNLDEGSEPTQLDMEYLNALRDELAAFRAERR